MTSRELVKKTIRGENTTGITPMYAWIWDNITEPLNAAFGSMQAFEDAYDLDLAMIFGGPGAFDNEAIGALVAQGVEITPEVLLQIPYKDPDVESDYEGVKKALKHYQQDRQRFCYIQTPGIFEALNGPFGIENHLYYMALYPEELDAVYKRQSAWNQRFINNMIDLGVDMVHVSDDWGAQNSLMFSPDMWREMIFPRHREMVECVHKGGAFASLHSDGNIMSVLDGIREIGYNVVHPFQETAGMDYQVYLERHANDFGIMGGLCIQSTLGFGDYARLDAEIRRVFSLLKGKRWIFCTTHLVQDHCSIDELVYAYDLAKKLSGK